MVDLKQGFANPLSDEALFTWHKMPDRGGRIETIGRTAPIATRCS
ncbi:hypothetical protein [Sinorhizobium meliloti]|nr:hypothetical protein [Sinorhizobium meliloti]